jgi:hypothetical protein
VGDNSSSRKPSGDQSTSTGTVDAAVERFFDGSRNSAAAASWRPAFTRVVVRMVMAAGPNATMPLGTFVSVRETRVRHADEP